MKPHLTFFCEFDGNSLKKMFTQTIIDDLSELNASISLGILDFSQDRVEVVRRLNQAGVPVIAWLLLPSSQGYWLNLDNASQVVAHYQTFTEWTAGNNLKWSGVGLDFEPGVQEINMIKHNKLALSGRILGRLPGFMRLYHGRSAYRDLIAQIHSDGYLTESYQFPWIVDERKSHSSLLQRIDGIINVDVDKEVLILYSSFIRPYGPGIIWSYGKESQAIALGMVGGGIQGCFHSKPLSWEELGRDLRLAWVFSNDIYIYSLEGCIQQGILKPLKDFEWDIPIVDPIELANQVSWVRSVMQFVLWLSANRLWIAAGLILGWSIKRYVQKRVTKYSSS